MRLRRSLLRLEELETRTVPTVYSVGPGQPYAALHQVPWNQVHAGDRVEVHWQATPYHDKIQLANSGTATQHIRVTGIPDPITGGLPVLDADGAIESPQASYFSSQIAAEGLITVAPSSSSYEVQYVDIANFDIENATRYASFTNAHGDLTYYSYAAAGVDLYLARDITISGCTIHGNENGIFGKSYGYAGGDLDGIVVSGNTIYGNGLGGSDRYHNSYIEGAGTVYEFNHYGALVAGSSGAGIKDRGAGTIVRYNWIEGGSHLLDLVDPADGADTLTHDPRFGTEYVYGNILRDPAWADTVTMIHFGFDEAWQNRQRTLYFYDNTVVNENDWDAGGRYRTIVFKASDGAIFAENNIFAGVSPDPGHWSGYFYLATDDYDSPTLNLGRNWASDWVVGNYGSSIVHGLQHTLWGGDPGFVDGVGGNYSLRPDSPCIGEGRPLFGLWTDHPVLFQYSYLTQSWVPRLTILDVGAIE